MSSPTLFAKFEILQVHDFCELFSDTHSPVSLHVNIGKYTIDSGYASDSNKAENTKLWDSEKIQTFLNNFDLDNIRNLCMQMDHLNSNGGADQGDINQIVNSINDMYITNCLSSFGVTGKGSK